MRTEFNVYVLYSLRYRTLYIGNIANLKQRLQQHNLGLSRYTKGRRPWKLVYSENFKTRSLAMRREKFLKSGQGREWLKDKL